MRMVAGTAPKHAAAPDPSPQPPPPPKILSIAEIRIGRHHIDIRNRTPVGEALFAAITFAIEFIGAEGLRWTCLLIFFDVSIRLLSERRRVGRW